jgi:3-hydroxyisobutyrate dehydrogenase-like beta-hydroxyacid dehydrogenase
MTTIAFFGCGNMGAPMARNLLKAGFTVRVFDLNPALTAPLAQDGAIITTAAVDTIAGADVVVTMLPHDAAVLGLYINGENGLLDHLSAGTLVIDCSTTSPECSRKVSAAAHARNIAMIDAPSPVVWPVPQQAH